LIVEDELIIAMEMESLLRGLGCIVLEPVPSIRQALRVLADERPNAAVLDVNLQGERVTPVAAALRERGIPFVLVSGYGRERVQEEPLQGAAYLRKPVDAGQLERALEEVLARAARD
jgi:two-component system, response regulator PdtaR